MRLDLVSQNALQTFNEVQTQIVDLIEVTLWDACASENGKVIDM